MATAAKRLANQQGLARFDLLKTQPDPCEVLLTKPHAESVDDLAIRLQEPHAVPHAIERQLLQRIQLRLGKQNCPSQMQMHLELHSRGSLPRRQGLESLNDASPERRLAVPTNCLIAPTVELALPLEKTELPMALASRRQLAGQSRTGPAVPTGVHGPLHSTHRLIRIHKRKRLQYVAALREHDIHGVLA